MNETGFEYLVENNYATVWSSERKWINRIIQLQESHSKDVQIIHTPESNSGTILAHIPKNWLKISPPKKVNMTEERKIQLAENLRVARQQKKG